MKLRQIAEEMKEESEEKLDERAGVDYGSAGLYLCGLQTVFTILCCSSSSILSCWLLPPHAISAVRTLAIVTSIGLLLVRKPLRIGRVRGVTTVFNALRPSVLLYIGALVLEQLVHTCVQAPFEDVESQHSMLRRALYHLLSLGLIAGGFLRARAPRSESDLSFHVALVALVTTAVLPPAAISQHGPLCEPTSLFGAGERLLRALLFGSVYTTLIYAGAPRRNESQEVFVSVARASAASVWILVAALWFLFLAPLQAGLVLFSRLNETGNGMGGMGGGLGGGMGNGMGGLGGGYWGFETSQESVPLKGATTPDFPSVVTGLKCESDLENGTFDGKNGDISDAEAVRMALATTRAISSGDSVSTTGLVACGNTMKAPPALSFSFAGSGSMFTPVGSNPQSGSQAINVAAIAAREAERA